MVAESADLRRAIYPVYDGWDLLRRQPRRLIEVSEGGSVVGEHEYDLTSPRLRPPSAPNRRITKTDHTPATAVTYHYYYTAAWPVVSFVERQVVDVRKNARSRAHKQYVWDLRYIDSPVLRDRDADDDANTSGYGKTASGLEERVYYANDANFNVTALVDTSGSVVERYSYDPYGKVSFYDGSWSDRGSSSYDNEILYCGYRYDPETGLYHVRFRLYHPTLGRWPVRDFEGYVDGMNLYQYVLTSPCNFVDPLALAAGRERLRKLLDRLKWNYTREQGRHQFTTTVKAVPVTGCPQGCYCYDVSITGTYARKLEKEAPSPLTNKIEYPGIYNLVRFSQLCGCG